MSRYFPAGHAGVGLGVGDGVGLGVGQAVGLGVGLNVGEAVGLGVGEADGLGVGDGVGDAVGFGVGEAVGEGVGRAMQAVAPTFPAVNSVAGQGKHCVAPASCAKKSRWHGGHTTSELEFCAW